MLYGSALRFCFKHPKSINKGEKKRQNDTNNRSAIVGELGFGRTWDCCTQWAFPGAEVEISDDKDHKGWSSGVPRGCVTLGMRGTVMLCAQQLSIHLPARANTCIANVFQYLLREHWCNETFLQPRRSLSNAGTAISLTLCSISYGKSWKLIPHSNSMPNSARSKYCKEEKCKNAK